MLLDLQSGVVVYIAALKNECKQTRMFAIVKEATGSSSAADSRWMNDLCVDTKLKQRVNKQMHFVTFLIHAIIWSKKTHKKNTVRSSNKINSCDQFGYIFTVYC